MSPRRLAARATGVVNTNYQAASGAGFSFHVDTDGIGKGGGAVGVTDEKCCVLPNEEEK